MNKLEEVNTIFFENKIKIKITLQSENYTNIKRWIKSINKYYFTGEQKNE